MDYKKLLKKYIDLVVENEGVSFIDDDTRINAAYDNRVVFTDEEWDELIKIDTEVV